MLIMKNEPSHANGAKETLEDKCTNYSQNTLLGSLNMCETEFVFCFFFAFFSCENRGDISRDMCINWKMI